MRNCLDMHDMWPYCGSEHYSNQNRYIYGYNKFNSEKNKKIFAIDLDKFVWEKKQKYLKNFHFVATSSWQETQLKKSSLFHKEKISKIFYPLYFYEWKKNTFDKSLFNKKNSLKKILFISERIDNPLKGFKFLKKLFNKSDKGKYLLIIIGNKNKETFKNLDVDYLFLNKIEDKKKLINIYSNVDLLIAPSLKESFGIVAQEAAYCNTPSVVFQNTGFEDTIKHKVNGYVAKYNNLNDMKKGIEWCLNKENLNRISKYSRLINTKKYSMEKIANEDIQLYENILNKN